MVRIYPTGKSAKDGNKVLNVCEVYCESTDTKPTVCMANGSICVENDTGTVFFFSEDSGDWVEQFSFQS